MAVPQRKTSKMRKNTRRSHDALTIQTISNCPNCGVVVLSHHACLKCNTYRGINILQGKWPKQTIVEKKVNAKNKIKSVKKATKIKKTADKQAEKK